MTANANPIFIKAGGHQWSNLDGDGGSAGPLKTQNTSLDGTGTLLTVYTAPSPDGGYVEDLSCAPAGTNIQTVIRVWLADDTGSAIGDAVKIAEMTLPATTAAANAALPHYRVPIRQPIPSGYRLRVALGTTVSAGYFICVNAGVY